MGVLPSPGTDDSEGTAVQVPGVACERVESERVGMLGCSFPPAIAALIPSAGFLSSKHTSPRQAVIIIIFPQRLQILVFCENRIAFLLVSLIKQ